MEKAAPLSSGNPGFIGSDDAPPEYSNFMAKEKEAEVRHSVIQIYMQLDLLGLCCIMINYQCIH